MTSGVETLLLDELKGLRGDVRENTKEVARLREQMANVLSAQEDAKDHSERLALLEQWRKAQDEDSSAHHAERRANLALIVSVAIAILGWLMPLLQHFRLK